MRAAPGNFRVRELKVIIPSYVCGIRMIIPFYWQAKRGAKKGSKKKEVR
jgi:hypothetical protein